MLHKFKALTRVKKIGLGVAVFLVIAAIAGGNQPPKQASLNVQHTSSRAASSLQDGTGSAQKKAPTITTKTVTETQPIPFSSTTVNDSTLAKGTTKVTTPGANGSETLTYKVTYTNGKQTGKGLVSQTTTVQPVAQVTHIGTYVASTPANCPNGTYVNTYGNTVCSPYASSSAPAGATAECRDGTYSFSQSRSGTCSHHGGVSSWL
jgi:hypothetical protein